MSVPHEQSSENDIELLRRDKYASAADADMTEDLKRLAAGEPLAYVIGWIPFLGCTIHLDSKPLIPRPETEYWTERLIAHLRERFSEKPFVLLDLCAGSGAIGIAVLKHLPNARVWFGEFDPAHVEQIRQNLAANGISPERAVCIESYLFESRIFSHALFGVIATNPPYIPAGRALPESVTKYEPRDALYSGPDGLDLIRHIVEEAPGYLLPNGELWMECDTDNIREAAELVRACGAHDTAIHPDHYGRERFIVGRFT